MAVVGGSKKRRTSGGGGLLVITTPCSQQVKLKLFTLFGGNLGYWQNAIYEYIISVRNMALVNKPEDDKGGDDDEKSIMYVSSTFSFQR